MANEEPKNVSERLRMETPDLVQDNIAKIESIFPHCITEFADENGHIIKKVDMDMLARELQNEPILEGTERYVFNWPSKFKTIREMKARTKKMLRPIQKKSVDFEHTENLYIEGDNLEAMLVLKSHYLRKIKVIYIDPPYNTGKDFVYADNFSISDTDYSPISGDYDETGNRLVINSGSNGRFHTNWLNMMYPRLLLSKDLLTEDGAIFISIDDNEMVNLRKICDEIFGSGNFVANLIWTNKEGGGGSDSKYFKVKHEYVLCYAKNINLFETKNVGIEDIDRYRLSDQYEATRGKYQLVKLSSASIQYSKSLDYPIEMPDGTFITPVENSDKDRSCWRWSKQKLEWGLENDFVVYKKDKSGVWQVYTKQYTNCDKDGNICPRTRVPLALIDDYSSTQASNALIKLMGGKYFPYPKPVDLVKWLIDRIPGDDFTALDFFSGSATTAHAIMELNAETGGHRKFVMIQYPETINEGTEAFNAGYKTICEIGEERIRKAAQKISTDYPETKIDTGFRVLNVDETCVEDVFYYPKELQRSDLKRSMSYFKPLSERSLLDRLFQALPEFDLPFSINFSEEKINGKTVFTVNKGFLIACLETGINVDTIREIANRHPDNALFCNDSMDDDSTAINCDQIFKQLSPSTHLRIM